MFHSQRKVSVREQHGVHGPLPEDLRRSSACPAARAALKINARRPYRGRLPPLELIIYRATRGELGQAGAVHVTSRQPMRSQGFGR